MSVYLVNFATHRYFGNQKIQNHFAKMHGIDYVISRNGEWLKSTSFYKENINIFSISKGFGLWAWKPFVILDVLKKINKNDVLFYLDSDFYIRKSISPLVNLCHQNNGVLLFRGNHLCKNWIKRDCFDLMGCDSDKFYEDYILVAGINFWKNNQYNISFLEEWLSLCQNFNLISDEPSHVCGKSELKEFKAHRHDQAILTLMASKKGIETFRNPAASKEQIKMDNSNYEVILGAQKKRIASDKNSVEKEIKTIEKGISIQQ